MRTGLGVERVVQRLCARRRERRLDGRKAGVCDRRGRQALVLIGVVRAVDLRVLIGQRTVDAAERIDDRRVDVQVRIVCGIAQAVIDNGGDGAALLGGRGLRSTLRSG